MKGFTSIAYISIALFLSIIQLAHAQEKITFGKVSFEELIMTEYKADTSASAIILSDVGNLSSAFSRHLRIKILKKSGLEWGNWIFNTPTKSDFSVAVFNLENGIIVRKNLDSKEIYTEEVIDDFEVYKVFAPNVKVGSVIDIGYHHNGAPFEWRFQERIPVLYSELTTFPSKELSYRKAFYGLEKVETVSNNKWFAKNMPAFQMEPFINNYSNYITRFEFQLESLTLRNGRIIEFSTSWKKVISVLLSDPRFGLILNETNFLNNVAKGIKDKNLPTHQAIEEVYHYVRTNAKWNGEKTLLGTLNFKKNFQENHSCNSTEINIALIILLNKIGINTYPVLLSTRDNGMLIEHSPSINKLNYVVGYVEHEKTTMFLDATSEFTIPGILPDYCLNGNGLVFKKDNEQWIPLLSKHQEQKIQFTDIIISSEREGQAKVHRDLNGYAYLAWMEKFKSNNLDADVQKNQIQNENNKVKILNYAAPSINKGKLNTKEIIDIDISSHIIDTGNELLFNPFVLFEYETNPFKPDTRKNPVDLIYPRELRNTITIKIPKQLTVKEVPSSTKFVTPDGAASFTYFANTTNDKLEFMIILKINKSIFTETEYMELRQFFSEVIKTTSRSIILAKR